MGVGARAMENLRPPMRAPATLLNPYCTATSHLIFFNFCWIFVAIGPQIFTSREYARDDQFFMPCRFILFIMAALNYLSRNSSIRQVNNKLSNAMCRGLISPPFKGSVAQLIPRISVITLWDRPVPTKSMS